MVKPVELQVATYALYIDLSVHYRLETNKFINYSAGEKVVCRQIARAKWTLHNTYNRHGYIFSRIWSKTSISC